MNETLSMVEQAPGRLRETPPVAVIDIGSNSVRLVAYEGLTRTPTAIFNEKVLCGLGRGVTTTGKLAPAATDKALRALRRFRVLCDTMQVENVHVLATAAARDASNGPEFLREAAAICRAQVRLLSGKQEAHFSAEGVLSGFWRPDGLVGDLGGGSLELVELHGARIGSGVTLPLGGLALQDRSGSAVKKADKLTKQAFDGIPDLLKRAEGRNFYAVGGTWRALARLHMAQKGYPMRVMHAYTIPAREAQEFCRLVRLVSPDTLSEIASVSDERRPLLPYGALVLENLIRKAKPKNVVISASGVREGLLHHLLPSGVRQRDPLISAAAEFGLLRARSPRHGYELTEWTDRLLETSGLDEDALDRRLRHAACHLGDIGWRAHPDYRGEQTLNIIANANISGLDHAGRGFLALAIFYRHEGLVDSAISPRIRELVSTRLLDRARVLGAAMRVAYILSAAMPGVLPQTPIAVEGKKLVLHIPEDMRDLGGDRVQNRLKTLARLLGREAVMDVA